MALNSKYNNYSERDKQVSILDHLDALDANTDELETLISDLTATLDTKLTAISQQLTTIESDLTTINSSISGNTREVQAQGQAIVSAIQGQ